MTTLLNWRYATKSDLRLRRAFVCTDPQKKSWNGYRLTHPAEWELDVQTWVRSRAIGSGQFMLLGMDNEGIGAVSAWVEIDSPADVLLQVVAVAMRYRRQGGACAKETLATALSHMEAQARSSGARDILIQARIDYRNTPSKRMSAAAGFEYDSRQEELEIWSYGRELGT